MCGDLDLKMEVIRESRAGEEHEHLSKFLVADQVCRL